MADRSDNEGNDNEGSDGRVNAALAGRTHEGLAFTRTGDGPPLVLLHGLGSSRRAWAPVLDQLTGSHTVYLVDLPGAGESAMVSGTPTPRRLAEALSAALDEWGLDAPHLAGHSLGAWIALELANIRPVASLTLLAPPGLWKKGQPVYCAVSLLLTWAACRFTPRLLTGLSRWGWGRKMLFWQLFSRPDVLSREDVVHAVADMARPPGFLPTFWAARTIRYQATRAVTAPVTLAFGARERLLLRRLSRFTDQLPPHTRQLSLPGAGHVLMSDAPDLVSRTVLSTTSMVAS